MTDQLYTPTTDEVRNAATNDTSDWNEARAEFDRWYAAEIAAAEQRGAVRAWDEAIDYAWDDSSIYQADAARAKSKNPYRADQEGTQDG